jgi:hypothetical protein
VPIQSRDVARREDPRHARLEILVDRDPPVHRQAGLLGFRAGCDQQRIVSRQPFDRAFGRE